MKADILSDDQISAVKSLLRETGNQLFVRQVRVTGRMSYVRRYYFTRVADPIGGEGEKVVENITWLVAKMNGKKLTDEGTVSINGNYDDLMYWVNKCVKLYTDRSTTSGDPPRVFVAREI